MLTLIHRLECRIDPRAGGLPDELFLFVSRITPLVNVDLLIQDDRRHTLFTWRSDETCPADLLREQRAYAAFVR